MKVLLHRKAGLVYVTGDLDRLKTMLKEVLKDKYVDNDWEQVTSFPGHLRIKALGKNHFDVTSISDPAIMSG